MTRNIEKCITPVDPQSLKYFSDTYGFARRNLLADVRLDSRTEVEVEHIQQRGIDGSEKLFTDLIYYPPNKAAEDPSLLVVTSGIHGLEGFAGSALQRAYVNEVLPHIANLDNGILLVHSLNPWGFKHERRVNKDNIDLNRCFLSENTVSLKDEITRMQLKIDPLMNPKGKYPGNLADTLEFYPKIFGKAIKHSAYNLRQALMAGQGFNPKGLCYNGGGIPRELQETDKLMRNIMDQYRSILMLDLHTGYGQGVTIILSEYSMHNRENISEQLGIRLQSPSDKSEYIVNGDMLSYYDALYNRNKKFLGLALEFGGQAKSSLLGQIRSVQIMRAENRIFHYGSKNSNDADAIRNETKEMFCSSDVAWRTWMIKKGLMAIGFLRNLFDESFVTGQK